MKSYSLLLCATLALAACGGDGTNPFMDDEETTDGGGEDSSAAAIPESVAGDVDEIVYDPATQTLTVSGVSLENTDYSATYARAASMDILDENGAVAYEAYFTQSDPLDRPAIAFARQSGNSGAVRGSVAVTGGQFNRYFGGTYYERDGDYTPPPVTDQNQGLVSYAGEYAGLTNVQDTGNALVLSPSGSAPGVLVPGSPAVIEGRIFLNVDFADNSVNGAIYNRDFRDYPGTYTLPNVILVATGIDSTGRFSGETVEYEGVLNNDIGDYSGIFGGPNAEAVAGGVRLTQFDGVGNPAGFENEEEYGVFVLDQCGTADENLAVCNEVRPEWP